MAVSNTSSGLLRSHSKPPASLKVAGAGKAAASTAVVPTVARNRSSVGVLPMAVRSLDWRGSGAVGAAVVVASPFHSPAHSPKYSPMSSPKSSPKGAPKDVNVAADALYALQRPARTWSTDDVCAWLQIIGLGVHADSFRVRAWFELCVH